MTESGRASFNHVTETGLITFGLVSETGHYAFGDMAGMSMSGAVISGGVLRVMALAPMSGALVVGGAALKKQIPFSIAAPTPETFTLTDTSPAFRLEQL